EPPEELGDLRVGEPRELALDLFDGRSGLGHLTNAGVGTSRRRADRRHGDAVAARAEAKIACPAAARKLLLPFINTIALTGCTAPARHRDRNGSERARIRAPRPRAMTVTRLHRERNPMTSGTVVTGTKRLKNAKAHTGIARTTP